MKICCWSFGISVTVNSGHGPDHDHLKPPTVSYFWVHFSKILYIVFYTRFSSSHNWTGLVPREPKKTQMKTPTVMTHQTAMGPKVLKNWYLKEKDPIHMIYL